MRPHQASQPKNFNTRKLIGESVIIHLKNDRTSISGVMVEYFETNNAICLKDCLTIHEDREGVKTEAKDELIMIEGKSWRTISVPKFRRIGQ